MSKFKFMLLVFFHNSFTIESQEQITSAVNVLVFAHENEPFTNVNELQLFITEMFYPNGLDVNDKPSVLGMEKTAQKWWSAYIG